MRVMGDIANESGVGSVTADLSQENVVGWMAKNPTTFVF